MISNRNRILNLQHYVNASEETLTSYLSVTLGSSWITLHNLNISEIELSMTLKALRKMIHTPFLYKLNFGLPPKETLAILKRVYKSYYLFYNLHRTFYNKQNNIDEVKQCLSNNLIFDLGVSRERFNKILFLVLAKISPEELELLYRINTIYRLLIVREIYDQLKEPLYIRGSLLFFNARSFGIGYGANFLGIEQEDSRLYSQTSGSDFDLRYLSLTPTKIKNINSSFIKLNKNHRGKNISFTAELASINKYSKDDLASGSLISQIIDLYIHTIKISTNVTIQTPKILSHSQILVQKNTTAIDGKVRLDIAMIDKLTEAFINSLSVYKANDEVKRIYSKKWRDTLISARMDTDYYGRVTIRSLKEAFHHVFLFSGYRFSNKDEELIFSTILYESTIS